MDLTHAEIEDLLGAYALDAVEAEERSLIVDHLRECPRCRAEVEGHLEVAGLLGNVGSSAPPAVWDRIAQSLDAPDDGAPAEPFPLERARVGRATAAGRTRTIARVGIGAAAAAAAVFGLIAFDTIRDQQDEIDDLAQEIGDAQTELTAADALSDPDSQLVALASPDRALEVRAVVMPDGTAYLLGDELPDLGPGTTYQLWGVTPDETVSLGVLGGEPGVVPFHVERPTTALAITREAAGGVAQSENEPVVSGTLS